MAHPGECSNGYREHDGGLCVAMFTETVPGRFGNTLQCALRMTLEKCWCTDALFPLWFSTVVLGRGSCSVLTWPEVPSPGFSRISEPPVDTGAQFWTSGSGTARGTIKKAVAWLPRNQCDSRNHIYSSSRSENHAPESPVITGYDKSRAASAVRA